MYVHLWSWWPYHVIFNGQIQQKVEKNSTSSSSNIDRNSQLPLLSFLDPKSIYILDNILYVFYVQPYRWDQSDFAQW